MKKKTPQWLQGCSVCNVGLCSRMDELIEEGKTEYSAARILEAEAFEANGGVLSISKKAIQRRYEKYKKGKGSWEDISPNGGMENQLKQTLKYLRTAKNKLQALNLQLQQEDITQIDGIEALLARVDLAEFAGEFISFINYLKTEDLYVSQHKDTTLRQIASSKGR